MRSRMGFTLVELLVVVLILGVLAFIAIPKLSQSAINKAKTNACKINVDLLNSQIELYYAITGRWPATLSELTENRDYFPDGAPECPFGNTYNYNSKTCRVEDHSHP